MKAKRGLSREEKRDVIIDLLRKDKGDSVHVLIL
jgi:hypothetical protein